MEITRESMISEIVENCPEAMPAFQEIGMHCIGCMAAGGEDLETAMMVHGYSAEDVEKDLEGLQTMRNLGRNIAFMVKAISAQKEKEGLPEVEKSFMTHFMDGKE